MTIRAEQAAVMLGFKSVIPPPLGFDSDVRHHGHQNGVART
jgi:hypothetical protein